MDYIKLKQTLISAFDHFLSCHDMRDLEEMMRALEMGKRLVIGFPEPIHREDYRDDIALMAAPLKKTRSRIRRKKPKPQISENHLCDIPVFMDLNVLSSEKQKQLCKVLKTGQHNMKLHDIMIKGHHLLAMAKISVPVKSPKIKALKSNWMGISSEPTRPEKQEKMKEQKIMLFHDKKQFDPP